MSNICSSTTSNPKELCAGCTSSDRGYTGACDGAKALGDGMQYLHCIRRSRIRGGRTPLLSAAARSSKCASEQQQQQLCLLWLSLLTHSPPRRRSSLCMRLHRKPSQLGGRSRQRGRRSAPGEIKTCLLDMQPCDVSSEEECEGEVEEWREADSLRETSDDNAAEKEEEEWVPPEWKRGRGNLWDRLYAPLPLFVTVLLLTHAALFSSMAVLYVVLPYRVYCYLTDTAKMVHQYLLPPCMGLLFITCAGISTVKRIAQLVPAPSLHSLLSCTGVLLLRDTLLFAQGITTHRRCSSVLSPSQLQREHVVGYHRQHHQHSVVESRRSSVLPDMALASAFAITPALTQPPQASPPQAQRRRVPHEAVVLLAQLCPRHHACMQRTSLLLLLWGTLTLVASHTLQPLQRRLAALLGGTCQALFAHLFAHLCEVLAESSASSFVVSLCSSLSPVYLFPSFCVTYW